MHIQEPIGYNARPALCGVQIGHVVLAELLTLGPGSAVQRLSRVEISSGRAEFWHDGSCNMHLQEPIGYKDRPALCGVQQCIQLAELSTLGPVCAL